jgi:uncharacterized protein (TIGR02391 family)
VHTYELPRTVANLLPKEVLPAKIADPVWRAFVRGEFDVAAFQAMKAVEVSVRAASGLGDNLISVKLMHEAFAPDAGALTDMNAEGGERVGRMELFAGAIASYKNPHHGDVKLDNPSEAIEIIRLANHLLPIVDARAKTKNAGGQLRSLLNRARPRILTTVRCLSTLLPTARQVNSPMRSWKSATPLSMHWRPLTRFGGAFLRLQ